MSSSNPTVSSLAGSKRWRAFLGGLSSAARVFPDVQRARMKRERLRALTHDQSVEENLALDWCNVYKDLSEATIKAVPIGSKITVIGLAGNGGKNSSPGLICISCAGRTRHQVLTDIEFGTKLASKRCTPPVQGERLCGRL